LTPLAESAPVPAFNAKQSRPARVEPESKQIEDETPPSSTGMDNFNINNNYFHPSLLDEPRASPPTRSLSIHNSPTLLVLLGLLIVSIFFNVHFLAQEADKSVNQAHFLGLSKHRQSNILEITTKLQKIAKEANGFNQFQILLPDQLEYWSRLQELHEFEEFDGPH